MAGAIAPASATADQAPSTAAVATAASPDTLFFLTVDSSADRALSSAGSADLEVVEVSRAGGRLRFAAGRAGGVALRYPAFDPAPQSPAAVVRVRNAQPGTDRLDPGTDDFVFGADVRLDRANQSKAANSHDDGNNVIQRGLYGDPTQYKIQIDSGYASCHVKGRAGRVVARAAAPLAPGTWYRLECSRQDRAVRLAVTSWPGGTATSTVTTATDVTGDLRPATRDVPLSVGGKLSARGQIQPDADQFNGLVERAYLRVGTATPPARPAAVPPSTRPAGLTRVVLRAAANKAHPRPAAKVRFTGTVRPRATAARTATVRLALKRKGATQFRRLRVSPVRVDDTFRFGPVRVRPGVYRIALPATSTHTRAVVKLRYHHRAFTRLPT